VVERFSQRRKRCRSIFLAKNADYADCLWGFEVCGQGLGQRLSAAGVVGTVENGQRVVANNLKSPRRRHVCYRHSNYVFGDGMIAAA